MYATRTIAMALAAAIASVTSPGSTRAEPPPHPALEDARTHWRELDFELVVQAAARVVAAADVRVRDRVEALWLSGSAHAVLGDAAAATASFKSLFTLDPDYEMPENTSPRIASVFRPARASWQVDVETELATRLGRGYSDLKMDVRIPDSGRGGQPVPVRVTLTDPARLTDRVVVAYRKRGSAHFSTLSAAPNPTMSPDASVAPGTIDLSIPGAFTASQTPYVLEYYVHARHRSGGALRRDGSADAPLSVSMSAGDVPEGTPLTQKWWFWTGAAALAASAVAIPLLVQRGRDAGPQGIVVVERP